MTEAEHSLIIGMTGAGKTTLNEKLIAHCRRIVTFTTKPKAKAYSTGWLEAVSSRDVINHIQRNWNSKKGFRIVWRVLPTNEKTDPVEALNWLSKKLFKEWQIGYSNEEDSRQFVLNIDEAQDFFPHTTPNSHWFAKVMAQGRDWGVNAVIGTQRPVNMHPKVRENIANLYSLCITGDNSIKTVTATVGSEHRDRIRAVKLFEYAYFCRNQFVCQGSTRTPKIRRKLP